MDVIFRNKSSSPSHFVTSLHLSRPPPRRSPSFITSLYFLHPASSCNHNLILCNQFLMKTPPGLDMLTHMASKQRSRRHKSSTTARPGPTFVAPKPLQLPSRACKKQVTVLTAKKQNKTSDHDSATSLIPFMWLW